LFGEISDTVTCVVGLILVPEVSHVALLALIRVFAVILVPNPDPMASTFSVAM
jgi:hypothetical protein